MPTRAISHLSGVLVADFSRVLAGPLCTMMLGEAGARVIKVEEPDGDETRRWGPPFVNGESGYFLSVNRGKESIALNLKSSGALEVARRLVARADVVVENFRPDQRERFGLAARQVREFNPRAVHCSIVGFESDGPDAGLPGYDLLAQAGAGLMSITGEFDGDPMKAGVALSDVLTAHHAHGAILAALFARERTGRGEAIEVSLSGSTVASLVNVAQGYLLTRQRPRRYGNEHPSIVPYQPFHAADRPFAVAAASARQYEALCLRVLERRDLVDDARYASNAARVLNRESLIATLERIFATRSADEWVDACTRAGVPASPVRTLDEVFAREPGLAVEIEHPAVGRYESVQGPVRWSGDKAAVRSAPPTLGQHTAAVLRELGFEEEEIRAMRARGEVV